MCRAKFGGKSSRFNAPQAAQWHWTAGLTVTALLLVANLAYLSGVVPPWAYAQAGAAATSDQSVGHGASAGIVPGTSGVADHWQPHNLALSVDGTVQHVTATATLDHMPQQQSGHADPQSQPSFSVGHGEFDSLPELRGIAVTPRRAIASIVPAIGDPHLAAVVTLAYSLRKSGNALPLVLFYIEGGGFSPVARAVAERAGWQMRPFNRVEPFKPTQPKYTDACAPPCCDAQLSASETALADPELPLAGTSHCANLFMKLSAVWLALLLRLTKFSYAAACLAHVGTQNCGCGTWQTSLTSCCTLTTTRWRWGAWRWRSSSLRAMVSALRNHLGLCATSAPARTTSTPVRSLSHLCVA